MMIFDLYEPLGLPLLFFEDPLVLVPLVPLLPLGLPLPLPELPVGLAEAAKELAKQPKLPGSLASPSKSGVVGAVPVPLPLPPLLALLLLLLPRPRPLLARRTSVTSRFAFFGGLKLKAGSAP